MAVDCARLLVHRACAARHALAAFARTRLRRRAGRRCSDGKSRKQLQDIVAAAFATDNLSGTIKNQFLKPGFAAAAFIFKQRHGIHPL